MWIYKHWSISSSDSLRIFHQHILYGLHNNYIDMLCSKKRMSQSLYVWVLSYLATN